MYLQSSQSVLMEFGLLLRLVCFTNLVLIVSDMITSQGREPFVSDLNKEKKKKRLACV